MRLPGAFDAARGMAGFFLLLLLLVLVMHVDVEAVTTASPEAVAPRYLVYPPPADGAPTKVQLIFGLGIPMEVEVSTIVGYVMKCNYVLPYNASYLGWSYVRQERSTKKEKVALLTSPNGEASAGKSRAESRSADRSSRVGGGGAVGRYEIYKMLESAIDSGFQSGKACLLRAICEVAATPLNASDGLFAQLLHIFLTPSSTSESYKEPIDQQYLAAELIGHSQGDEVCVRSFPECDANFLEYFSRIR